MTRTVARLSAVLGAAAALGLLGLGVIDDTRAEAGTYVAVACDQNAGLPETAVFESDPPWTGEVCAYSDSWLTLGVRQGAAISGSDAQWRIDAPVALRFSGGWFQADPARVDEYESSSIAQLSTDASATEFQLISSPGWYQWSARGPFADRLVIRTRCIASRCTADAGRPEDTMTLVRSFGFRIEDRSPAEIGDLDGALMEGAAQRGTQVLAVPATDVGGGVGRVTVKANGTRVASLDPGCALGPDGRALRLAPCPASVATELSVDTTAAPFAEGENSLEACVADYAQETNDPASLATESCTAAPLYVDNSCDVARTRDAADVRFGFERGKRKRRTVTFGRRATVVGALRDAADQPIEGATVCVSTRDRLDGAREIDVDEVETNRRGKARVALPKGASRRVKLTYWANEERVEMRTLDLNVRARPRLRVLSKRRLSDGGKARFRVTLGGPYRAKRRVSVQALAPAGWLDFPGCTGKTDRRGAFRCAYRFREQAGSVRYQFRALAPRQPGYPYLQGRSRSKRVTVRD